MSCSGNVNYHLYDVCNLVAVFIHLVAGHIKHEVQGYMAGFDIGYPLHFKGFYVALQFCISVSSLVRGRIRQLDHQELLESRAYGTTGMIDDPYVAGRLYRPPAILQTTYWPEGATSPDYVPDSDPEEDPEEDDDEDPEENPVDYLVDGGDDGDDEDESSDDDEDDDVDIEVDDDEEEGEHPAPADSTAVALPAADQAPSLVPTPLWSDAEVARLLAISTPPSSPLSPYVIHHCPDSFSTLPRYYPPTSSITTTTSDSLTTLPVSSPVPVLSPSPPASPIRPLGYRAVMIRLRVEAASTSHSLPLPPPIILSHTRPDAPSSRIPPLHLLSTDRREDRPEVTLPPRKRLGIALDPRYEIGESPSAAVARPVGERDVGYGITDSWDKIVEAMQGTPVVTDVAEFSQRMTEFETRVRRDTMRDRRAHAQVMSLHTTMLAQQSEIRELQSADRRRQTVITVMLAADHRRQEQLAKALKLVKRLQDSDGRVTVDSRDLLMVRHSQSYQRRLVAVPRSWLSGRGFTAGRAALKAASGKVTKHEKACIENQHVFIPFAFDTFGFLAPEAVELLSRVKRVMHSNVMTPRSTDVVFKRIGFAIQKGLAAQLVARLPSTTT
ncbi:hypothetical protein Tco_0978483 [Tanacetum coccineum]|uniref:Reverse transcriptase domain-containing protein n=1 Tax=Tanacetum coccineum TaxID=301880 RepID=A0ABQ5EMZ4_9ASTR